MKTGPTPQPIETRFWKHVQKTDHCWNWIGAKCRGGYGQMRTKRWGGPTTAHRIAYALQYGSFDPHLYVLHRCDNRACVRPDHLFLGTFQDNMDDMFKKKRNSVPPIFYGEQHVNHKLTIQQVLQIRELFSKSENKRIQASLARQFNVDRKTIFNVIYRKQWNHI